MYIRIIYFLLVDTVVYMLSQVTEERSLVLMLIENIL